MTTTDGTTATAAVTTATAAETTTTAVAAKAPAAAMAALRTTLQARLTPAARAWLDQALASAAEAAEAAAGPPAGAGTAAAAAKAAKTAARTPLPAWELRFAEAGRHCGGAEDAAEDARVLLLHTARARAATVARLYHQGTAAERRAVLLALPQLGIDPAQGLPLVEDALRANDTRLIAAAVGPYAAEHLTPHAWRHAVLKCLFTGVPVDTIAALPERARGDAELARMLGDYAEERTAAGRPVPDDLHRVLAATATEARPSDATATDATTPAADRTATAKASAPATDATTPAKATAAATATHATAPATDAKITAWPAAEAKES